MIFPFVPFLSSILTTWFLFGRICLYFRIIIFYVISLFTRRNVGVDLSLGPGIFYWGHFYYIPGFFSFRTVWSPPMQTDSSRRSPFDRGAPFPQISKTFSPLGVSFCQGLSASTATWVFFHRFPGFCSLEERRFPTPDPPDFDRLRYFSLCIPWEFWRIHLRRKEGKPAVHSREFLVSFLLLFSSFFLRPPCRRLRNPLIPRLSCFFY